MFAILLGTQVVQLGIFARAFAHAHLGETDALVERARDRLRLEHGLAGGGILLLAGTAMLLAIFVGWAIRRLRCALPRVRERIGFTLVALGTQVVLGSFFLGLLTMRTTDPSHAAVVSSPGSALEAPSTLRS